MGDKITAKVGIPSALLSYTYGTLWEKFFEYLGHEPVTSGKTTKQMMDIGVKLATDQTCLPVKTYFGHAASLAGRADYIFLPRIISLEKGCYICPKFMGLPDMVRYSLPGAAEKILYPQVKSRCDDISNYKNFAAIGEKLGKSGIFVREALRTANREWKGYRAISHQGYSAQEAIELWESGKTPGPKKMHGGVKIGLMGYVYDIYDEFVSMNVMDKLRDMEVDVVTFEMFNEKELDLRLNDMKKKLFWTFSNKLLGAGYKFFDDPSIDGIVHVTAFGCGPDSLVGKLMELESIRYQKPFMTVRVDEHTGENHLLTRFEAFIDMLKRKHSTQKKEA
jgi:predicted nucleotide-binding protein (sugar kinase/HSP70/actin superfamily)